MDEESVHQRLLQNGDTEIVHSKKTPMLVSVAKWVLKFVMWVLFLAWIAVMFLLPAKLGSDLLRNWVQATRGTIFGVTGSIFLVYSGPILVIAFLCIAYLIISGDEEDFHKKKSSKHPRFRLWTFPVLVDGPFGVVSATEFIGIFLFVVFVIWAVYAYTIRDLASVSKSTSPSSEKFILMLEVLGLRLGMIGLLCTAWLLLPIARGSVLLRFIDIPYEHATRYHVWLGHLTMILFTLHSLFYVIAWAIEGRLIRDLLQWANIGIANLPGVISFLAGVLLWVTSLHPVRKQYFELFFYTHQLYIIFVVFLALHVGDYIFSYAAGGMFLYILDRFLRFCQSRRTVNVLSAKCLPCGTVELVLSKPPNLRYNALSFIFLQVRELSWVQWHPFSVSSSPLESKNHVALLINVLGGWTAKLQAYLLSKCGAREQEHLHHEPHTNLTISVEGPYGHESPYYLMYENLILVGGGIGVSPFLAIVRDILHRIKEGKSCLPKNVLIVWAVKKSNELSLLTNFDMESICPSYSDKINIEISIYVTRESEPSSALSFQEQGKLHEATKLTEYPVSKGCGMSVLVGTGNNIWSGLYLLSSTIGFIILVGMLDFFYIIPYGIDWWWYKGLLFTACMVASVLVFGGVVIGFWHLWERITSSRDKYEIKETKAKKAKVIGQNDLGQMDLQSSTSVFYGSRPDFEEILANVSKKWVDVDVGVLVCGPPALQASVAKEIRSHSLKREQKAPIFHFNSHTFDL